MNDLIFWGVIASLVFSELTGVSPGGVIVPAYITLYLYDPWRVAATLVLSLACAGLIKIMSQYMILYGRRRMAVYLLTGILLKLMLARANVSFADLPGLSQPIGFLIPGLLGREVERQGVIPTFAALGIVCCVLWLASILMRTAL